MTRLLLLVSDLNYGSTARQTFLLARHLFGKGIEVRVCVLKESSPWTESLQKQGLQVDILNWRRPFDITPFLSLRKLIKEYRPEVVHVCDPFALRALRLIGGAGHSRLVLSGQLSRGKKTSRIERILWPRWARYIAHGQAEARAYQKEGIPERSIDIVPLAVEPAVEAGPIELENVPRDGQVLLWVGPFLPQKGGQEAVWSLDILHYLFENLYLVLVGDGEDLPRARRFAELIGASRNCRFVGSVEDLAPYYARADVVWVTGRSGGLNTLLEAMAAGKAIVSTRQSDRDEIVVDGKTGLLAIQGDKPDLCRQTRLLLEQEKRRTELGLAARERALDQFAPGKRIERMMAIYQGVGSN